MGATSRSRVRVLGVLVVCTVASGLVALFTSPALHAKGAPELEAQARHRRSVPEGTGAVLGNPNGTPPPPPPPPSAGFAHPLLSLFASDEGEGGAGAPAASDDDNSPQLHAELKQSLVALQDRLRGLPDQDGQTQALLVAALRQLASGTSPSPHQAREGDAAGDDADAPAEPYRDGAVEPAHLLEQGYQFADRSGGSGRPKREPTLRVTDADDFIQRHRLSAVPSGAPIRVCLITSGIAGPTNNGGIATAFYSLAKHLAEARADDGTPWFAVTVLYAAHPYYGVGNAEQWVAAFAKQHIAFVPLPAQATRFYGAKFVVRSYRIFEWLRLQSRPFDIISYHDYMAIGYFTALAKHQGIAFQTSVVVAQCHSTIRWTDEINYRPPKDHHTLAYYYMEQKSLEYADARVSPSAFFLGWMDRHARYDLSHGLSFVVQNTLYPLRPDRQEVRVHRSSHFVFFSRLNRGKGLMVTLDALDAMAKGAGTQPTAVTFMGPAVSTGGMSSNDLIEKRQKAGGWRFRVSIENRFNTQRALEYIREHGAIVLLPTLGDNSPYAVVEIIAYNLPMITTDAGGGVELIRRAGVDPAAIVPAGNPAALQRSMEAAMTHGIRNVEMASSFTRTRDRYVDLMRSFHSLGAGAGAAGVGVGVVGADDGGPGLDTDEVEEPVAAGMARAAGVGGSNHGSDAGGGGGAGGGGAGRKARAPGQNMMVTLGVTSHNRPDTLFRAVEALAQQNYPRDLIYIVIVDDNSDDPEMESAFAEIKEYLDSAAINHEIIRHGESQFVAHSRNQIFDFAVKLGSDFVCLMDDDDIALPNMVDTYMKVAAKTGADMLTDISDNYDIEGESGALRLSHRSLAVGNAFAHNFFANNYGKANFCVRPDRALAIGGHATGHLSESPYVDWAFFTRASLHNLHIEMVPLVLYRYVKHSRGSIFYGRQDTSDKYKGHAKMLQDMEDVIPEKFHDILAYCRYNLGKPPIVGDGPL